MFTKIDSLESKRLILEVLETAHAEKLYKLFCEPDLYHYIGRDVPPSVKWLRDAFTKVEKRISPDEKSVWLNWPIVDKKSGSYAGYSEFTITGDTVYIAYTVFKPFWGQGIAVEATAMAMEFVQKNYPVKRFIIEMDTRNRASTKVAEKLGFHFVGTMNNVRELKGMQSHEFQFEKIV